MHTQTLPLLRDMIDLLNCYKIELYFQRRLTGKEQDEYKKLMRIIDDANNHLLVLQREADDEKKKVF